MGLGRYTWEGPESYPSCLSFTYGKGQWVGRNEDLLSFQKQKLKIILKTWEPVIDKRKLQISIFFTYGLKYTWKWYNYLNLHPNNSLEPSRIYYQFSLSLLLSPYMVLLHSALAKSGLESWWSRISSKHCSFRWGLLWHHLGTFPVTKCFHLISKTEVSPAAVRSLLDHFDSWQLIKWAFHFQ